MNPAAITALAAVGGSCAGALGPVLSAYLIQRGTDRRGSVDRTIAQRQLLYSDFIKEASALYARSLTTQLENLDGLISLSALLGRIHLLASDAVVAEAELYVRSIVNQFGKPNLNLEDLRKAIPLAARPDSGFSLACRKELNMLAR
ncbi:MAG: hypothetical protein ABSF59_22600 [Candidatus Sulfotelmatobacter sp.]|jgi:hypothetical protein